MEIGYITLIIICIFAVAVLGLNIQAVLRVKYFVLKLVCISLFIFTMFRYVALGVYGDFPVYSQLEVLRYFYFASSIGLTLSTVSVIWYIVPRYRDKIKYPNYVLLFIPWIIFYLYIIIAQPTAIEKGEHFGYVLELTGRFPLYLSFAQSSIMIVTVLLSLAGIIKYKNMQMRVQLAVIIIAQMALTADGLTYFTDILHTFPTFTVSEIFGFLAVWYGFSKRNIEIRGIQNK